MDENPLTFAQWIEFEARRIPEMGLQTPPEHQADYIYVQIATAPRKAFAHGRDGMSDADLPRTTY